MISIFSINTIFYIYKGLLAREFIRSAIIMCHFSFSSAENFDYLMLQSIEMFISLKVMKVSIFLALNTIIDFYFVNFLISFISKSKIFLYREYRHNLCYII
jgi:hypothetical protein